jgi:hypothetical protein
MLSLAVNLQKSSIVGEMSCSFYAFGLILCGVAAAVLRLTQRLCWSGQPLTKCIFPFFLTALETRHEANSFVELAARYMNSIAPDDSAYPHTLFSTFPHINEHTVW